MMREITNSQLCDAADAKLAAASGICALASQCPTDAAATAENFESALFHAHELIEQARELLNTWRVQGANHG